MNNTAELRQLLYELKQNYGFPIDLYKRGLEVLDMALGTQSFLETKYAIRKATILSSNIVAKYFKHNQIPDFNYGGDLTLDKRVVIIDRKTLPPGLEITQEDSFIYQHKRYSIETIGSYDVKECYFLGIKQAKGSPTYEQIEVSLQDWIYVCDGLNRQFASNTLTITDSAEATT